MNTIIYHIYYLESQFAGFPLVIKITVFLITLLVLIYLISIFRIFLIARSRNINSDREARIKNKYEEKLRVILFSDNNISSDQIKKDLNLINDSLKEWEKSCITHLMMNLIKQNEKNELETKRNIVLSI